MTAVYRHRLYADGVYFTTGRLREVAAMPPSPVLLKVVWAQLPRAVGLVSTRKPVLLLAS